MKWKHLQSFIPFDVTTAFQWYWCMDTIAVWIWHPKTAHCSDRKYWVFRQTKAELSFEHITKIFHQEKEIKEFRPHRPFPGKGNVSTQIPHVLHPKKEFALLSRAINVCFKNLWVISLVLLSRLPGVSSKPRNCSAAPTGESTFFLVRSPRNYVVSHILFRDWRWILSTDEQLAEFERMKTVRDKRDSTSLPHSSADFSSARAHGRLQCEFVISSPLCCHYKQLIFYEPWLNAFLGKFRIRLISAAEGKCHFFPEFFLTKKVFGVHVTNAKKSFQLKLTNFNHWDPNQNVELFPCPQEMDKLILRVKKKLARFAFRISSSLEIHFAPFRKKENLLQN